MYTYTRKSWKTHHSHFCNEQGSLQTRSSASNIKSYLILCKWDLINHWIRCYSENEILTLADSLSENKTKPKHTHTCTPAVPHKCFSTERLTSLGRSANKFFYSPSTPPATHCHSSDAQKSQGTPSLCAALWSVSVTHDLQSSELNNWPAVGPGREAPCPTHVQLLPWMVVWLAAVIWTRTY